MIGSKYILSIYAFILCFNILNAQDVIIYETNKTKEYRFQKTEGLSLKDTDQPKEYEPCVFIDTVHTFQIFIGIGGAITDASSEVFAKIPGEKQDELITAYFDPEKGIGYTFARTHIASCDFSSESYDYVEEGDKDLKTFSIKHDEKFRIPMIKRAMEVSGNKLKLMISPWSPPAWMKDNNDRLHGGKLMDEYKQSWANHYVKFIHAYVSKGIPVWGLSVQNEPMAVQKWESCIYTDEDERDFVKNYLGLTLKQSGLSDKKLIVWDHNRDLIYHRASTILNDPEAAQYVWGVGFHWYETWTGSSMLFNNLIRVKEAFPDINILFTEGCVERFDYDRLNDWSLGERYGTSMMNDFNAGTVAWADWNILLNEKGGPNHVGNFCFAPIIANQSTSELIYTNSYYYIGHFSKFIKPGAKRVSCSTNRDKLQATAFINPNGKVVVVVLNTSEEGIHYQLFLNRKAVKLNSLGHSIQTIII